MLRGLAVDPVAPRFEDGFMLLLRAHADREPLQAVSITRPIAGGADDAVVQVQQLLKKFGNFTAVDCISFEVRRGEIFGLLGPNGAGKTTTFRMLCGLLAPSAGQLRVAGADVRSASASARARLGYVAQKFALYGPLSVLENLEFFASAYGLRGQRRRERIVWATQQFELTDQLHAMSSQLPGGYKQRLDQALGKIRSGDPRYIAAPDRDSYHTVWFELHQDLIGLAGTTRQKEAAAGRAV